MRAGNGLRSYSDHRSGQGFEANHSGKFLERALLSELEARGWLFKNYDKDANTLDILAPRVVITNAPYMSMYGCKSKSEFVITDYNRKIRAECRWQEAKGSVDEKYVYMLTNAVSFMPEREVLIVHGGDGARPEAIAWLKREAAKVTAKRIYVININELTRWVRRELIDNMAVA